MSNEDLNLFASNLMSWLPFEKTIPERWLHKDKDYQNFVASLSEDEKKSLIKKLKRFTRPSNKRLKGDINKKQYVLTIVSRFPSLLPLWSKKSCA